MSTLIVHMRFHKINFVAAINYEKNIVMKISRFTVSTDVIMFICIHVFTIDLEISLSQFRCSASASQQNYPQ